MRTYPRLLGNFWEPLGKRRSLSSEGTVQVEAGMGEAAWGCGQHEGKLGQEAGSVEGPIPDSILCAPGSSHTGRLSTPWTFSYTIHFCLSPLECIPSLANEIVMIYLLSSCPCVGQPRWRGTFILSIRQRSDLTCTQTSLERQKQDWKRREERWKLWVPHNS